MYKKMLDKNKKEPVPLVPPKSETVTETNRSFRRSLSHGNFEDHMHLLPKSQTDINVVQELTDVEPEASDANVCPELFDPMLMDHVIMNKPGKSVTISSPISSRQSPRVAVVRRPTVVTRPQRPPSEPKSPIVPRRAAPQRTKLSNTTPASSPPL